MGRVFVGIPTVNRPRYVRETIRSVLDQTFRDIRVLVSDNVSDAPIADSVERFVRQVNDPRIGFHRQPEDVGEYGQGRLFLQRASTAEFFVMLHDDDVLKPTYLEKAISRMTENPSLAYFVANPFLMDAGGRSSEVATRRYLSRCGRIGQPEGVIDVLSKHFRCGFTPISGTFFRTQSLRDSGFVDDDLTGSYPFEPNVLLRLGERGARAWFCPEELLGFRFHSGSQTSYARMVENPQVVISTLKLFERRRFTGTNERRRRIIVGRLYRALAVIRLKTGDNRGCRENMLMALRRNPLSLRSFVTAPFVLTVPGLLRMILPPLPAARSRPEYAEGKAGPLME